MNSIDSADAVASAAAAATATATAASATTTARAQAAGSSRAKGHHDKKSSSSSSWLSSSLVDDDGAVLDEEQQDALLAELEAHNARLDRMSMLAAAALSTVLALMMPLVAVRAKGYSAHPAPVLAAVACAPVFLLCAMRSFHYYSSTTTSTTTTTKASATATANATANAYSVASAAVAGAVVCIVTCVVPAVVYGAGYREIVLWLVPCILCFVVQQLASDSRSTAAALADLGGMRYKLKGA